MKIRIQTAQNVEIEYEVAGIGYRFQAALIDLAVFLGYFAFWGILALVFDVDFTSTWLLYVLLAPPVPLLLYPLLCEIFMRGQTIGKKAMNLKVVRVDGGEPSIGSYVLRWLLWIVEANPLTALAGLGAVSVVSIVSTKLGQRVGDIAAGTTVVRLDRQDDPAQYVPPVLSASYEPQFPEVRNLTARDVGIIRRGYGAVTAGAGVDLATKIAYRVAEVLAIPAHKVGETTNFLARVLNDHAFFTRDGAPAYESFSNQMTQTILPENHEEERNDDDPSIDPLSGY